MSNTGETRSSQESFTKDYLQKFTTGNTSVGYRLTKLDLQLEIGGTTTPTYSVTIHAISSGGLLDTLLGTLDKPTSLATGINSFTAPGAGIYLAPNTTYFVVLNVAVGGTASDWKLDFTDSNDEDSDSASGWSISDDSTSRNVDNTGATPIQAAWKMALHGQLWPPGVTSATVNGTALTLTYGRGLNTASTPAAGDYTVKVGGTNRPLAGTNPVVVSGSTVTLTLGSAVTHTDTVTVSYTAGTNPIEGDSFRVAALNLTDQAVTNETPDPVGISEVAIASDPGAGNTYAAGETIQVQVTFGHAMNVTGTPRLKIKFDPAFGEKWADYASGSGTSALTFAYTPESGDTSTQGIAVLANTLELNGGTITLVLNNTVNAVLTHAGLPHDANHLVETTVPALTWAAVYGTKLTLTFSKDLDEDSQPAGSAFSVTPGSQSAIQGTGTATVAGATVTVTLASAAPSNTVSTFAYAKPASGLLRDVAGHEVADLSSEAAVNYTGLDAGGRLLLSNIGQAASSTTRNFSHDFAQGIRPGASTKGFRVTEAKLALELSGTPNNLTYSAQIYTHDSATNHPGTLAGTFNNPASLSTGSNTFTAPRGIDLARDGGTSWLVLDVASITNPASASVVYMSGTNFDAGTIPDWDMLATSRQRTQGGSWGTQGAPLGTQFSGREDGPDLSGVAVSGTAVTLTYERALDTGSTPAGSDFTVNVAGTDVPLAATTPVTVSGSAVTLRLDSAVTAGQAVTVTYTAATNPIQDTDGVDADNLAGRMVVNNLSDPVVTGVAITSDPGAGNTYGIGDTIQVTVTFNLAVNVDTMGGTPRLKIKMDPGFGEKWAEYASGSGGATLTFAYEVVSGNHSPQGIAVLADTLQLNGGTIKSTASSPVDAALGHVGLGHDPNHRVDTGLPVPAGATANRDSVTVSFNEDLDPDSRPAGSAFSVTAGNPSRTILGKDTATVAGSTATVTLASAVNTGEEVDVSYTKPASGPLRDVPGNEAATYSAQPVDNLTGQDPDPAPLLIRNNGRTLDASGPFDNDRAQKFTIPPSTRGFTITAVNLRFSVATATTATYSVTIRNDDGGLPGTVVATLENPAAPVIGFQNTFGVPGGGVDLGASGGSYWLVVDTDSITTPNNYQVGLTDDDRHDFERPGWDIGNNSLWRANSVTSWEGASSTNRSVMLRILGRESGPVLSAATVSGTQLTLAYDRALDTASTPAASDFAVEVAASPAPLAATNPVEVSGSTVTLTLDSAVTAGKTVEVTYNKGTNPVQGPEGTDATELTGREVTNSQVSLTPAVSGVAITSNPGADSTYIAGDTIQVGLTFDRAVNVTGTPRLKIKLEPHTGEKWANYASGHGTANLTFSYTVVSGNNSQQGIAVLQNTLELNGGTIKSTASTAENANLAHTGLAHDANHLVDTSAPQLAFAAVNGATLALTFDEDLDEGSRPAGSAFTVTATAADSTVRTITGTTATATVDGATATVTLTSAASQGETLKVAYAKPASGPLRDVFGHEVAAFSGRSAANNTGQAQTSVNLVSNTGQATQRSFQNLNRDIALGFTTGSAADGYMLTSVQIGFDAGSVATTYAVRIHNATAGGGVGGTSLGTLENPTGLVDGLNLFEASGTGIELDASTSYFVVIDFTTHGGGGIVDGVLLTQSDDEDSGGAAGWSLFDSAVERLTQTDPWANTPTGNPVKLSIHGFLRGAPALSSTTVNGAAVTLTYDRALDTSSTPATGDFTVTVNGTAVSLAGTNPVVVSGSAVTLNLASAVTAGQSVTVTYTPGTNPIRGSDGTDAGSLTNRALENQTPGTGVPPPVVPPPVVPPPDGGTTDPLPTRGPDPLQLALWTDRPAYRAGETVRLYRTVIPHGDREEYRVFAWLEPAGGGERRYLAPLSAAGGLHPDPVDLRGMPEDLARARILTAADRELAFEGEAPEPGLWQFVLELRPAADEEPDDQVEEVEEPLEARRAWANFTVAERFLLLNRRGFDREVRDDLTLRSDTIYRLGHQLFVHDGATLTIEAGTVVLAWGRNTAIIVERGGRIVAEGTRQAPVVLTSTRPSGQRYPGSWGGLRILGKGPVTRLEGVAPGVLPPERPVYGGTDREDSGGVLRYVRVEFAGASGDPEVPGPAIGLYGAGSGTILDHVQARASLGDGFAFHGGAAVCDHCVASGSGNAGLSWERGWRGGATHLYVQHGQGGVDGLAGANDNQGYDLEPRSLPTLSNVTLIHALPYGDRERRGVALRLSTGSGVRISDLLATRFGGGAIDARGRSALLFREGESSVTGALLWVNGRPLLRDGIQNYVDFIAHRDTKLRDVRDFANPDPRPKVDSPALPDEGEGYIGAFGRKENWLEEWTVFGPESVYDLRELDGEGN